MEERVWKGDRERSRKFRGYIYTGTVESSVYLSSLRVIMGLQCRQGNDQNLGVFNKMVQDLVTFLSQRTTNFCGNWWSHDKPWRNISI